MNITILNNTDNSVEKCGDKSNFGFQNNDYSIIYINHYYQVVNKTNFLNMKCNDISILEKIKTSEFTKKIKNFIYDSPKEELITNLNKLIKNGIIMNNIDENKEFIIQRNEMTIAYTSTSIQKKNENSNTTVINLGKCEKKLKNIYNISEESHLYILKIDTKQDGKNYPLVEYEVFYPLNNGNMELLNLSFCKGIDIELSIPIIINDTIDKYNPKSYYYNDICSKTPSKCNTDITLNDRRNGFINNNMSLCEDNCELTDYDYDYKKAKCSCNVKTTLSLDNHELDSKDILKNFIDINKITNIQIAYFLVSETCKVIDTISTHYRFDFNRYIINVHLAEISIPL